MAISKAVRFHEFGAPSVPSIDEIVEPHAASAQIRVAVRAVGLHPIDSKMRSGAMMDHIPIEPVFGPDPTVATYEQPNSGHGRGKIVVRVG